MHKGETKLVYYASVQKIKVVLKRYTMVYTTLGKHKIRKTTNNIHTYKEEEIALFKIILRYCVLEVCQNRVAIYCCYVFVCLCLTIYHMILVLNF